MRSRGRELSLFAILLVAGLALANLVLVVLSLLPLMVLLFTAGGGPSMARVEGPGEAQAVWTGDDVEIKRSVRVGEGSGLVIVSDPLPSHSTLARGNNIRILWKDAAPAELDLSYRLRMTRRGRYRAGPSRTALLAPSIDWTATKVGGDNLVDVMVRDRTGDLRRLSDTRLLPRLPLPPTAVGMLGAQTTEFMELRAYAHGDRFRNINWKATSRSAGEKPWPLVNTYKVEENRSVLILLDNGPTMAVGSSGDDVFERCVHASLGLSQIYLANRLDVGVMAIDSGETVRPGSGRRQEVLISHMLLGLELGHAGGSASAAIRAFPEHVHSGPLIIIVTSVRRDGSAGLGREIRLLRAAMGRRGKVVLINVKAREEPAEGIVGVLAQELVDLGTTSHQLDLTALGVPVHTWDPREGDLTAFVKREFGVPG